MVTYLLNHLTAQNFLDLVFLFVGKHDFAGGEIVTYSADGNAAVTGLTEGGQYQVIVVDDDTIQLRSIPDNQIADLELTATGGRHKLSWDLPSVIESLESVASQKDDTVQALTITVTSHEFEGGEVINRVDPIRFESSDCRGLSSSELNPPVSRSFRIAVDIEDTAIALRVKLVWELFKSC